MSAEVIAYSANPWDTELTLKVECPACCIEWGWSSDSQKKFERLKELAANHNAEYHNEDDRTDADYDHYKESLRDQQ